MSVSLDFLEEKCALGIFEKSLFMRENNDVFRSKYIGDTKCDTSSDTSFDTICNTKN